VVDMDLNRKVELSVQLIKEFARKFGAPWVAFSGGKDSTAVLLLVLEALQPKMVRGAVFIEVTGNTHDFNIWYAYRVADRLGVDLLHLRRDDLDFFNALVRWGVPMRGHRWCMNEFKIKVFKVVRPPVFLVGVKHSDSLWRERSDWSRPKMWNDMVVFSPIWFWTTQDIRDFIKSRNIDLCPCYELYNHSGNCMYCPFHNTVMIRKTIADPVWGQKILGALSILRNDWGKREYRRWSRYVSKTLESFMGRQP